MPCFLPFLWSCCTCFKCTGQLISEHLRKATTRVKKWNTTSTLEASFVPIVYHILISDTIDLFCPLWGLYKWQKNVFMSSFFYQHFDIHVIAYNCSSYFSQFCIKFIPFYSKHIFVIFLYHIYRYIIDTHTTWYCFPSVLWVMCATWLPTLCICNYCYSANVFLYFKIIFHNLLF